MGEKPEAKLDEQAGDEPKVKSLVSKKPQALSGIVIRAYYHGTEAEKANAKVAAIEGSNLKHLFKYFPQTDFQTFKAAVKDYKDLCKEGNVVPKVAKTRAAEMQALFGAYRWAEYQPTVGYHAAVAEARRILTEKKLKWDGGRVKEKWEKTIEAEVMTDAEIELETRKDIKRMEMEGKEVTEELIEEVRAKHFADQQSAEMRNLAASLVKKYGTSKCEQLVDHLTARIVQVDQEAKDAANTSVERAAA